MCYTTDTHWFSCTKGLTFTNLCHHVLHVYLFFILSGDALTISKYTYMDIRHGCAFHNNGNTEKSLTLCVAGVRKKNIFVNGMVYDVQKNDLFISIFQFFFFVTLYTSIVCLFEKSRALARYTESFFD